ncbi:MAG: nuclear transport factor 2 family protein [Pseudomonadota bacterium]
MTLQKRDASEDKSAIMDVLNMYCRAMDRMDRELALSCWHTGGTDNHAPLYAGSAEGFIDWLWPTHAAMISTHHMIGNCLISLNGDAAGVETYWSVTLRIPKDGRVFDYRGLGRYVDNFEYLDGRWAIRHRQSIRDWTRTDEYQTPPGDSRFSSVMQKNNPEAREILPQRDRSDYSYSVLGLYI